MAIPVWPAGVNYMSQLQGFSVDQLANPVLETDMNAGTTRQRNDSTVRIAIQKLAITMKAADLAAFDAFYISIGCGAARFTMPVWNGIAYVLRTVAIIKGQIAKSQFSLDTQLVSFAIRIENL